MKEIAREVVLPPPRSAAVTPARLSVVDQLNPKCYVCSTFVYAPRHAGPSVVLVESALRSALVALVARCPLLAGRLRPSSDSDGAFEVALPPSGPVGALLVVADAHGDAVARSDAFGDGSFDSPAFGAELLEPLDPADASQPLLALRATRLADGGLCVGLSVHHWVADAAGFARIALCLARECRAALHGAEAAGPPPELRMDRSAFEDGCPAVPARPEGCGLRRFDAGYSLFAGVQFAGAQALALTFGPGELAALRSACGRSASSTRSALMAHVWRLVAQASARDPASSQPQPGVPAMLAMAADSRSRMRPPLPEGFVGNANVFVPVWAPAGDLLRPGPEGLAAVAAAISGQLAAHTDAYIRGVVGWLSAERASGAMERVREEWRPTAFGNVYATDWSRCPLYEADVGLGRPVAVLPPKMATPSCVFCIASPVVEGGILVYLQVTASQAAVLRGEMAAAIHAYDPARA
eukprot:m51a1_g8637 putative anthranilate n-benzoyltransferase (468) ;mRNA; f:165671-167074